MHFEKLVARFLCAHAYNIYDNNILFCIRVYNNNNNMRTRIFSISGRIIFFLKFVHVAREGISQGENWD